MVSELITEARQRARVACDEHPSRLDLEAIERTFGRQLLDERMRSGVQTARARASRLAEAGGGVGQAVGIAFAADLFVSLAVERPWRPRDVRALLPALATLLDANEDAVSVQLLVGALRAPHGHGAGEHARFPPSSPTPTRCLRCPTG